VPRRRFGQNFLHDPRIARRIAAAAEASPGERVLEIGPGLGALTFPLLESGAKVTAIEIDARVADFLEMELAGREDFSLVRGDVCEADLDLLAPDARVLVANLPYSITGPILALLIDRPGRFERAIGAVTVLLRLLWRLERLFDVGAGAFLPAPEVISSVLRFTRIPGSVLDPFVKDAVNRAYRQRRKMLKKTLAGTVAEEGSLARALGALGYPDTARPESVEPADWPRLVALARGGTS
jgi:16S rRNA (adenine1518-N6/adenine1519-N6)-dimethyltransferase